METFRGYFDKLNNHVGRVSVGKKRDGYYEILAYSDQEEDFPELHRMAKKSHANYINSVISEGVTAHDVSVGDTVLKEFHYYLDEDGYGVDDIGTLDNDEVIVYIDSL